MTVAKPGGHLSAHGVVQPVRAESFIPMIRLLRYHMNLKLRKDALALRQLVADGASEIRLRRRAQALKEVYRMAAYSFGEPPTTFDLEYKDDKHQYHRDAGLTPKVFEKYSILIWMTTW